MKAQAKYVQLLERELEFMRDQLGQLRQDIVFYRGKVERLELSLREAGVLVAAPAPAEKKSLADTVSELKTLPSGRLPFSEIKRRWQQMDAAAQEKAITDGWNLEEEIRKEEEEHARSGNG